MFLQLKQFPAIWLWVNKYIFFLLGFCVFFAKTTNVIEYIRINENLTYLSVPYVDAQPIAIVPLGMPSGIDITAPFFRRIKLYRDYSLLDEVLKQSDRLNENEKIKWIIRWSHSEDFNLC